MLDLRRDLCARLVISAHKEKNLNKPFHVVHAEMPREKKNLILPIVSNSAFEEKISSEHSNIRDISANNHTKNQAIFPLKPFEKIDEKVERTMNDTALSEIQLELEFAEELLKKIKKADSSNPKIHIIEKTISKLKLILEEKMQP
jgi:hypothetical protein